MRCKECHQTLPGMSRKCCVCEKEIDYPDNVYEDGAVIGKGNHEYHFHINCLKKVRSEEKVEYWMNLRQATVGFSGVVRIF